MDGRYQTSDVRHQMSEIRLRDKETIDGETAGSGWEASDVRCQMSEIRLRDKETID